MNKNDTIEVAESLYYEANPNTKMDTPSFVYERVEKWQREWMVNPQGMNLYDWIKLMKK
jgi:hypothetical protein